MQAEQQSELQPCPFCGAVGLDFKEGSTFRWIVASCSGCGASTGETRIQTLGQGTKEEWMAEAQQDAIAAWNRRAAFSHPSPQGWKAMAYAKLGAVRDKMTPQHVDAVQRFLRDEYAAPQTPESQP